MILEMSTVISLILQLTALGLLLGLFVVNLAIIAAIVIKSTQNSI